MWGETTRHPPPQGSSGHLVIPRSLCSVDECSQDKVDPNLTRNATGPGWLALPQDGPEQLNPGTPPGRRPPLDDSGGPALGLAPTPGVSTPPAQSPLGRCRSLASWTLHEDATQKPRDPQSSVQVHGAWDSYSSPMTAEQFTCHGCQGCLRWEMVDPQEEQGLHVWARDTAKREGQQRTRIWGRGEEGRRAGGGDHAGWGRSPSPQGRGNGQCSQ